MNSTIFGQLTHGNVEMLVLGLLSRSPLHGYAIRNTLQDLSYGLISPSFGRLYPLLSGMEQKGFVTSKEINSPTGRKVRQYSITNAGSAELDILRGLWNRFSSATDAILGKQ